MKQFILSSLFIVFTLSLNSCREAIDVDLNEANPKAVITARLSAGTHDFEVKVTQTTSYFDNLAPKTIDDASVTITDQQGNATLLTPMGNGSYKALNYTATANQTYTLKVVAQGKTYTANSFLSPLVPLDSLTYEVSQFQGFGDIKDTNYTVYCNVKDPADQQNAYRGILTLNDTLRIEADDIYTFTDEFTNGNLIRIPYFGKRFKKGDKVQIELLNIDYASDLYWQSLSQIVENRGGGSSASPANPVSNMKGGALGYFEASSSSTKTIVIQ